MSVKRKSKDHQKAHKGVELVPAAPPRSADPLMFWTNHPTENTLIDLRPFSHGTSEMGELVGGAQEHSLAVQYSLRNWRQYWRSLAQ